MSATGRTILLTGATGYLGALIVASLLRDTNARIVCLTRAVHDRQALLTPIVEEWEAQAKGCWSDAVEERVEQMALPLPLPGVRETKVTPGCSVSSIPALFATSGPRFSRVMV